MKRKIFKGRYTTTLDYNTKDVFFEIMKSLMRVFELEKSEDDLDYIINWRRRSLMVTDMLEVVFSCEMLMCKNIAHEPLTNKENIMKRYNISETEWDNVIAYYPNLNVNEPIKNVYAYEVELTIPVAKHGEYLEIAANILKEIC